MHSTQFDSSCFNEFQFQHRENQTFKPLISQSSNLVSLLMLMSRFQILHFPSPEMARFFKKCKQKFGIFQNLKFEKFHHNSLTSFLSQNFFSYLIKVMKKFCQIKTGKNLNFFQRFQIFFCIFWKNWPFLDLEIAKFGIQASKLLITLNLNSEKMEGY